MHTQKHRKSHMAQLSTCRRKEYDNFFHRQNVGPMLADMTGKGFAWLGLQEK